MVRKKKDFLYFTTTHTSLVIIRKTTYEFFNVYFFAFDEGLLKIFDENKPANRKLFDSIIRNEIFFKNPKSLKTLVHFLIPWL